MIQPGEHNQKIIGHMHGAADAPPTTVPATTHQHGITATTTSSDNGGGAKLVVRGHSMHPTLPAGTVCVAVPTPAHRLRVGDVIAFRSAMRRQPTGVGGEGANAGAENADAEIEMRVVVHRVWHVGRTSVRTRGDSQWRADRAVVRHTEILGRVVVSWRSRGGTWCPIPNGRAGAWQHSQQRARLLLRRLVRVVVRQLLDVGWASRSDAIGRQRIGRNLRPLIPLRLVVRAVCALPLRWRRRG